MKKKRRGFTLIEVLIALVIIAIALTAVYKFVSNDIGNVGYLQEKTVSHWVALDVINSMQTGLITTKAKQQDGYMDMLGTRWLWYANITTTPNPYIDKVVINVRKTSDGNNLSSIVGYLQRA